MKRLLLLALFFSTAHVAVGEVSTRVCRADGNTPLELADPNIPFKYRDIMVGTELTIIVDSNIAEVWDGALAISGAHRDYGFLSGRDYNEFTYDYEGSHLPAAGDEAVVWLWHSDEQEIDGFYLSTDFDIEDTNVGDWFIIDYNATAIGDCNVDFYDYAISAVDPHYYLEFSHVRTRDFNKDTKVDFGDFTVLASYWQQIDCGECGGADLDDGNNVDVNDLMLFTDYWLETTE